MPLETASTIDELNVNNPTATDGLSQGDDHLRLIKSALKGTFENFDGTGVASTEAELDAGAAIASDGAAILSDGGAFFKTNDDDGFTNPAAGEVDVEAGGEVVVKFKDDQSAEFQGDADVAGDLTVTGSITGPGSVPIGGTIIWWSDTLPTDAGWTWANGATYLRSNTALFAVLGTKYGVGDGATTAGLPDLREAVPIGKSTMGASSARGIITNFTSTILTTLGQLFGEATHLLTISEIPGHTHGGGSYVAASHSHPYVSPTDIQNGAGGGAQNFVRNTASTTTGSSGTLAVSGSSGSSGGDAAHNNVQPSIVCNWIIRTA